MLRARLCVLCCAVMVLRVNATAQPLTTAFTYQGELKANGDLAQGPHDMRFRLYDGAGVQIGSVLCSDNVSVVDGRFVVTLDFGSVYVGQQRFLEVDVRADTGLSCASAAGFTTLSPRTALTATPFSSFATAAGSAATATAATSATTATNSTQLNGQAASFYTNAANLTSGTIADARLSSNIAQLSGSGVFTGLPAFNGGTSGSSAPFFVDSTTRVANLNADLLDGQDSGAFALAVHTHDAAAINSGLLADARLSSNIPRLNASNVFATGSNRFNGYVGIGAAPDLPLTIVDGIQAVARLTSFETDFGSVIVLENNTPDLATASTLGAINFSREGQTPGQISYTNDGTMYFRVGDQFGLGINASGVAASGYLITDAFQVGGYIAGGQGIGLFTTRDNDFGSVLVLRNENPTAAADAYLGAINFEGPSGTTGQIAYLHNSDSMTFRTGGQTNVTIDGAGTVSAANLAYIAPRTSYLALGPFDFSPADGSPIYSRSPTGIFSLESGVTTFTAPIHLPHGATITEIRFYVYDNADSDLRARVFVTTLGNPQASNELVYLTTTGRPGWAELVQPLNHPVDNATNFLFAAVGNSSATFLDLVLRSMRITYTMPAPVP
jgi:hypothetical protein